MPAKREAEPLVKVTLNLFASDYERMQQLYIATGAAKAIRAVIRAHVQRVEARAAQTVATVGELDIEMEDAGE